MKSYNVAAVIMAMTLAAFAADVGAQGVAPAPPPVPGPFDGHYQGTLVCERVPNAPAVLRAPLDIIIAGTDARFARPMFNIEGTRVTGSEMASGTIGADGKVQFVSKGENGNATFQASYSGTIATSGGTLSGMQTFMSPGGSRTRACHAAFVKSGR